MTSTADALTSTQPLAGSLRTLGVALVLMISLLPAGCGRKSATQPNAVAVTSILSQVSIGTSSGEPRSAELPAGSGPAPSVSASDSFVAGSRVMMTIVVPDSAVALLVGASGHPGHFRVALTPAAREAMALREQKLELSARSGDRSRSLTLAGMSELALVVGARAEDAVLPLLLGVEFAHSTSQPASHTFSASSRAAASDQLQVTLSWTRDVDLDLHVQAPVGADSTDIYYGNRLDAGASLDLDSNAACALDGVRSENVTWGTNLPPQGNYRIRVDLWSRCGLTDTIRYVLTIRQCGQVRQLDRFALRTDADGGTLFSGKVIDSFSFTPCAAPQATAANAIPASAPWRRKSMHAAIRR